MEDVGIDAIKEEVDGGYDDVSELAKDDADGALVVVKMVVERVPEVDDKTVVEVEGKTVDEVEVKRVVVVEVIAAVEIVVIIEVVVGIVTLHFQKYVGKSESFLYFQVQHKYLI